MSFDEKMVLALYFEWKRTGHSDMAGLILIKSESIFLGVAQRFGLAAGQDAEENINTLRIKAWRKLTKYDPERGRIFSFLTRISENECRTMLRKRNRTNSRYVHLENGNSIEGLIEMKQLLERDQSYERAE
ncbi:MAG: sigma factor [Terriglobales bacterium]|jgi:DNA-directed RNA polymerase specialized sigma24 family protein